ncbi:MAG: integrase/recombinase XerC, partial [Shewanella sp.]
MDVNWFQHFERYLSGERMLSKHTIRNYLFELNRVDSLLDGSTKWTNLSREQLQSVLSKLHRKGLSPRSLSLTLSATKQFCEFLVREGAIQANPAISLSAPKQNKPLPKNMDLDSVTHLLEIEGDDPLSLRDKAIMELFYSSGLRLAELAALDINDIQFSERLVKVMGKGSKERIIPIGKMAITAIET